MEYQCGNIFLRPNRLVKGGKCFEHMHEFSHVTFFVAGKFRARRWRKAVDGQGKPLTTKISEQNPRTLEFEVKEESVWVMTDDREFSGGQWCLIERDVKHEFECLSDEGYFCCCYSHRDPQSGEVVQGFNGWMKAYE